MPKSGLTIASSSMTRKPMLENGIMVNVSLQQLSKDVTVYRIYVVMPILLNTSFLKMYWFFPFSRAYIN